MQRDDFTELLNQLQHAEHSLNQSKGKDYCGGDEDALRNFKQLGTMLGLAPLQICAVYMAKHFLALMSHAKRGQTESEPIEQRVADLRLYAALFLALVMEERNNVSS